MDQLEASNHPRVMSEAQTRIHRLAMARLRALETEIAEKHHLRLMCGIELEYNYRQADGTMPSETLAFYKYNHNPSEIAKKTNKNSLMGGPFIEEFEPDGLPAQNCHEFKISPRRYIQVYQAQHASEKTPLMHLYAPHVIAQATQGIRAFAQKRVPELFPGHQAQFMAADPVNKKETADIHVNMSVWDDTYTKSMQHVVDIKNSLYMQKALFPLVIESANSLQRFGRHNSIATEFKDSSQNKLGNSLGVRVFVDNVDSKRIEDRLAGADADPALATLVTLSGIYWALEHDRQVVPLDVELNNTNKIPNTKAEYAVFLSAFEKSAVAREMLGPELFQEITSLRRAQYNAMEELPPVPIIRTQQLQGKLAQDDNQRFI